MVSKTPDQAVRSQPQCAQQESALCPTANSRQAMQQFQFQCSALMVPNQATLDKNRSNMLASDKWTSRHLQAMHWCPNRGPAQLGKLLAVGGHHVLYLSILIDRHKTIANHTSTNNLKLKKNYMFQLNRFDFLLVREPSAVVQVIAVSRLQ